ncbi:MAG: glycosyltransferase [Acidobacteriota bacterium]
MKFVFFGLTVTSSWGNGHATTYRSLLKALAARGHRIHFIEKDVEWYRSNRDLPAPEFCTVHLYDDWDGSARRCVHIARDADAVVVGSFFPDAISATRLLLEQGNEIILFYDIDTPVTMARLRDDGNVEYLDPTLIPHYAAYLSFTGGPLLREIETRFGSPWAVPFYCSVDSAVYKPTTPRREFQCDLSYLGTYACDRQPKLERYLNETARLLPGKRMIVAGPQYPQDIAWPQNVERIIHLSPREHPAFYSSSRFTLNVTRDDMVAAGYSPSVRLFEASACSAAILSDDWPGLSEFLTPGQEILLPHDAYEVSQILLHMSHEERLRIGLRARDRILAEHTAEHRAAQFEEIVERCQPHTHAGMVSASNE